MNDLELAVPLMQAQIQPEGGNIQLQGNVESRPTLCNSLEKKCKKLAKGIFGGFNIGTTIACTVLFQVHVITPMRLNEYTEDLINLILKIVLFANMCIMKRYAGIGIATSVTALFTSVIAGLMYGFTHLSGPEKNMYLATTFGGLAGGLSVEIINLSRELLCERNVNRL